MKVKSHSCARLLATPWTAAYQAPPSMGFSRQEYWSGVPLPSPKLRWSKNYSVFIYKMGKIFFKKVLTCRGKASVIWKIQFLSNTTCLNDVSSLRRIFYLCSIFIDCFYSNHSYCLKRQILL